eukprot:6885497-Ditylum_brightwellii.AAC.1
MQPLSSSKAHAAVVRMVGAMSCRKTQCHQTRVRVPSWPCYMSRVASSTACRRRPAAEATTTWQDGATSGSVPTEAAGA